MYQLKSTTLRKEDTPGASRSSFAVRKYLSIRLETMATDLLQNDYQGYLYINKKGYYA
jgi:hypothetical protein